MIRCAVDAREYSDPGRLTGVGRFLTNIVAPLATGGSGMEFILFTHRPASVPSKLQHLPGVQIEALPCAGQTAVDQWFLPRLARQAGADCFFSPCYRGPLMVGMPMVITVHDIMILRLPALTPWKRWATRWRLGLTLRRAQKVITVSKFTERDLVALYPQAADKTVVMYSDIGSDWYRLLTDRSPAPPPAVSPELFGRFFLYVGNFKPHKNVDLLVRAFHAAVLAGRLPDHCLVLVGGDEENTDRVVRLIRRLDLEKRVHICRDIDDFSLARLYQAAHWFVSASQYEGFGYPPVEAMIADCPVICHPVTSLIEVVGSAALPISELTEEGVAGALARAAGLSAAARQEVIEAGRRQYRLFTPGQTAAAFSRLLHGLT